MDATDRPHQPQDVLTLRNLIEAHTDRTGESRRALGDRSGLAHQTLGYWWAGTIKTFPDPDTIRAFARATNYSEQTVLLAAARTVGLRVTEAGTPLINTLPPGTDALRPEDVDAIRAVVRQLVEARSAAVQGRGPALPDLQGIRLTEEKGVEAPIRNGDT